MGSGGSGRGGAEGAADTDSKATTVTATTTLKMDERALAAEMLCQIQASPGPNSAHVAGAAIHLPPATPLNAVNQGIDSSSASQGMGMGNWSNMN
eukprot:gene21749-271_t